MLLKDLVDVWKKVRSTMSKKEKISFMANFLASCQGEEIKISASYISGNIPQGSLGIGVAMLMKVERESTRSEPPLAIKDLDSCFERLSRTKGRGTQDERMRVLNELFRSATEDERDFITGLILGELRHGAQEGIVLEAISKASRIPLEKVRKAMMFSGDIGEVAKVSIEEGINGLDKFGPRLFEPVSPMLANQAETEGDPIERWKEVALEFKIDGARIQVHKEGDEVRVFTRHLKDVTERVPEIVSMARRFRIDRAIFEGETFATMPDGKPMPFQITMRRFGRAKNVDLIRKDIPLNSFFFDLLYIDGESILEEPYRRRTSILSESIEEQFLIPRIIAEKKEDVFDFLQRSISLGHEGIMAKWMESPYIAGHRGYYWLKIKRPKTLDLVVLAAEWGHGRRKGFLSNLQLGAWNPDKREFIMLGKTFKGLTDEMLRWQTEKLLSIEIARDEWTVYVKPMLVVEVAFDDIQKSPRYPGGVALRFARVRRYRLDKSPEEADTIMKVVEIFERGR